MNKVKIIQDSEQHNDPRGWDNLGTMACFHSRYKLGDTHGIDSGDYNGWDEMENAIIKENDTAVILPLYLYDHSGITISTSPFQCRFDSGQIGFIFISKEKVRKEYGVKRISSKLKEKIKLYLEGEVETYDQFIRGEIYGFEIEDENENHLDSCWGFFGSDPLKNGMLDHISRETYFPELTEKEFKEKLQNVEIEY